MPRLLLSIAGGLLVGITMWFIGGFLAGLVLTEMPGGKREGQGAMTGMFFVGPIIGIIALVATAIIIWNLSSVPARIGPITMGLAVLAGVMVLTVAVMFAPKGTPENPAFKGLKGGVLVEVKFQPPVPRADALVYQLRKGGESLDRAAQPRGSRTEDSATIVPGEFPLHGLEGFIIFAIMESDHQRDVSSIELPTVPESTEWSPWLPMDQGSHMRWRVVAEKK